MYASHVEASATVTWPRLGRAATVGVALSGEYSEASPSNGTGLDSFRRSLRGGAAQRRTHPVAPLLRRPAGAVVQALGAHLGGQFWVDLLQGCERDLVGGGGGRRLRGRALVPL